MKEDTQLICPLGYEDPSGAWSRLEPEVLQQLPLRDVTWKSHLSSSFISINKLPLRLMPASANLFKDADHPFRWFLAPYVNIFVAVAETMEQYRILKPKLKSWLEMITGSKSRSSWLIIYSPKGSTSTSFDTVQKIYSKICSDFHMDKSGDRSVMLLTKDFISSAGNRTISAGFTLSINAGQLLSQQNVHQKNCFGELCIKLRDGVVFSFEQRCILYDLDIRRLDALRGTPQLDFCQLFLVKESLALMYQMMQLYQEALLQMMELEALLSFVPAGVLLTSDWPLSIVDIEKLSVSSKRTSSSAVSTTSGTAATHHKPSISTSSAAAGDVTDAAADDSSMVDPQYSRESSSKDKDASPAPNTQPSSSSGRVHESWTEPSRQAEDVLYYSINTFRMRIVRNKIGVFELHKYVFARSVYFLTMVQDLASIATTGLTFITSIRNGVMRKLTLEEGVLGTNTANAAAYRMSPPRVGQQRASNAKESTGNKVKTALLSAVASGTSGDLAAEKGDTQKNFPSVGGGDGSTSDSVNAPGPGADQPSRETNRRTLNNLWTVTSCVKVAQYTVEQYQLLCTKLKNGNAEATMGTEERQVLDKEGVFKALAALLQFAFSVFESLVDDDKYSSDTAGETKPITNYLKHMRKTAAVMVQHLHSWDSLALVRTSHPFAFGNCKDERERKCLKFISSTSSSSIRFGDVRTTGLEEVMSVYPQKLRHMFRAKSYSTHNTTTSAEKKAISRDVAKQLKSEAALFLLGFMVIFNAMANRPKMASALLAQIVDIHLFLGNFQLAEMIICKMVYSEDYNKNTNVLINTSNIASGGGNANKLQENIDPSAWILYICSNTTLLQFRSTILQQQHANHYLLDQFGTLDNPTADISLTSANKQTDFHSYTGAHPGSLPFTGEDGVLGNAANSVNPCLPGFPPLDTALQNWLRPQFELYRRVLLCARVVCDEKCYLKTSLKLLLPQFKTSCDAVSEANANVVFDQTENRLDCKKVSPLKANTDDGDDDCEVDQESTEDPKSTNAVSSNQEEDNSASGALTDDAIAEERYSAGGGRKKDKDKRSSRRSKYKSKQLMENTKYNRSTVDKISVLNRHNGFADMTVPMREHLLCDVVRLSGGGGGSRGGLGVSLPSVDRAMDLPEGNDKKKTQFAASDAAPSTVKFPSPYGKTKAIESSARYDNGHTNVGAKEDGAALLLSNYITHSLIPPVTNRSNERSAATETTNVPSPMAYTGVKCARKIVLDEMFSINMSSYCTGSTTAHRQNETDVSDDVCPSPYTMQIVLNSTFPMDVVVTHLNVRFVKYALPSSASAGRHIRTDHLATGSDSEHDEDELFDSQHSQMALSRRASALNSPFANLNLDADGGLMNLGHVRSSTFNSPTPALARASSGFFRRQRSSGNGSGDAANVNMSGSPRPISRSQSKASKSAFATSDYFDCFPYFVPGKGHGVGSVAKKNEEGDSQDDSDPTNISFVPTANSFKLAPGLNTIPLFFNPSSVGDYTPCEIHLSVGNIDFYQSIAPDLTSLTTYFSEYSLVSIVPPQDILSVKVFPPVFSPFEEVDTIEVHLHVDQSETLDEFTVYAFEGENEGIALDGGPTSVGGGKSGDSEDDTCDLAPWLLANRQTNETADSMDEYRAQIMSTAMLNHSQVTNATNDTVLIYGDVDHSRVENGTEVSVDRIVDLDDASNWTIRLNKKSGGGSGDNREDNTDNGSKYVSEFKQWQPVSYHTNTSECESRCKVASDGNGVCVQTLPPNHCLQLIVPFHVSSRCSSEIETSDEKCTNARQHLTNDNSANGSVSSVVNTPSKHTVCFMVQGVLTKRSCRIPVCLEVSCVIIAGSLVSVDYSDNISLAKRLIPAMNSDYPQETLTSATPTFSSNPSDDKLVFEEEYFCQCVITNISAVDIRLCGYELSCDAMAGLDENVDRSSPQEGITRSRDSPVLLGTPVVSPSGVHGTSSTVSGKQNYQVLDGPYAEMDPSTGVVLTPGEVFSAFLRILYTSPVDRNPFKSSKSGQQNCHRNGKGALESGNCDLVYPSINLSFTRLIPDGIDRNCIEHQGMECVTVATSSQTQYSVPLPLHARDSLFHSQPVSPTLPYEVTCHPTFLYRHWRRFILDSVYIKVIPQDLSLKFEMSAGDIINVVYQLRLGSGNYGDNNDKNNIIATYHQFLEFFQKLSEVYPSNAANVDEVKGEGGSMVQYEHDHALLASFQWENGLNAYNSQEMDQSSGVVTSQEERDVECVPKAVRDADGSPASVTSLGLHWIPVGVMTRSIPWTTWLRNQELTWTDTNGSHTSPEACGDAAVEVQDYVVVSNVALSVMSVGKCGYIDLPAMKLSWKAPQSSYIVSRPIGPDTPQKGSSSETVAAMDTIEDLPSALLPSGQAVFIH